MSSQHLWILILAVALGLVGCPSSEERVERAQEAVPKALARGDRIAAQAAVADLGRTAPDTPEGLLELADLLGQAGEMPRALWLLETGMERYPDDVDVQLALAQAALALANPSLALSVAARVPEDAPRHSEALLLHAQAELGLGNLERALEILRQAEDLYPDKPETRLQRIATLTTEKRHDEAAQAIDDAIAAASQSSESTAALRRQLELMRAQVQMMQGEKELAIGGLRSLVAGDPSDLQAWQILVQGLAATGKQEEAIQLLEEQLEGEAPPLDYYMLLAPLYSASGRKEEAEQALRALNDGSDSPAAVIPLVNYLAAQGDSPGVEEALRGAIVRFPDEAALRIHYAEVLMERGDLASARREADAYAESPDSVDAYEEYLRARFELAEGDAAGAAERLRNVAPKLDLATTQFWLGRALEAAGDDKGARRRFEMATLRDPGWSAPVSAVLALEVRRGDWEAAGTAANRLVQVARTDVQGWLWLSRALIELERGKELLEVSSHALRLFPDEAEFRISRAQALRLLGRREEALAELAKTEGATDEDGGIAARRALALAMLGSPEEGLAIARENVDAHPQDARAHATLASLYFYSGAASDGERAVDRAMELDPDQPSPLYDRCRFRTATGRFAGAVEDCRRYLAERPADARAQPLLGAALAGMGRRQEAIAAYRRVAELDEDNFEALNNLAMLLAAEGDLDAALTAGQEAYRLSGENPYVADTVGDLYLRKGLVERAIALLEGAHAAAPEMPDARLHLAQAYTRAGRAGEARALLAALDAELPAGHPLRPQLREALDEVR
ncbi:MAG: tetratricopeptide repeat protein [bacterium]|nr:tetratricopeptide repeat protein [bacterium]